MTTTLTHLFLSEWKHLSMTNLIAENQLHNTARKVLHLNRALLLLDGMDTCLPINTHLSNSILQHKYITNPTVTPADAIIAATVNLAHVLMSNTAAAHLNATQLADLTQLRKNHPAHIHR
eukprot:CCRYP_020556-RA/>CCRYP_020556-RA protein AED:0.48 eAED:1.00 QI:0/0/0/1/0/0/2/0/119